MRRKKLIGHFLGPLNTLVTSPNTSNIALSTFGFDNRFTHVFRIFCRESEALQPDRCANLGHLVLYAGRRLQFEDCCVHGTVRTLHQNEGVMESGT